VLHKCYYSDDPYLIISGPLLTGLSQLIIVRLQLFIMDKKIARLLFLYSELHLLVYLIDREK